MWFVATIRLIFMFYVTQKASAFETEALIWVGGGGMHSELLIATASTFSSSLSRLKRSNCVFSFNEWIG